MIILDLEWNRGYDKEALDEILQIGAVRVERLGEPVVSTFSVFIRPRVHKKFTPVAKQLPELQQSIDSELDFPTAYGAFQEWCGEDRVFIEWGSGDLKVLRQNCEHWELPFIELEAVYDFQWAFSNAMMQERQFRLCDAIDYLGIASPFCFHNAMNDAFYTALVGEWLGEKRAFAQRPEPENKAHRRKQWRFAQSPFLEQKPRKVGPFQSRKVAWNARAIRRTACPVCGAKSYVHVWYSKKETVFYGPFQCKEHGHFLVCLTLNRIRNGMWSGHLRIPELTPEVLAQFESATTGASFHPKSTKRKKRKAA